MLSARSWWQFREYLGRFSLGTWSASGTFAVLVAVCRFVDTSGHNLLHDCLPDCSVRQQGNCKGGCQGGGGVRRFRTFSRCHIAKNHARRRWCTDHSLPKVQLQLSSRTFS